MCKKYYLEVIQKELGITYNGNIIGNKVYIPVCQEASDIYKFHKDTLLHVFGIKLLDENQCIKIHFRNYCKVIQKRTGISFFWSVDNSLEFIDKISDIKTAHSLKTFDFSALYTNLPLDVIDGSLKSLIIKMFANSKSIAILVHSYRKKAFWSNGYPSYREYTIDKLLKALEIILLNTYIQFNGTVFKQILGIPMGGNASPFIADLYLSWCDYCYVTNLTTTDYNLAKRLSYNCRYLDDIWTVNLKDFDTISKDIYDKTLILEGSTCS